HAPCGASLPSYYRNGNATSAPSSTNTTTPASAVGIPDAVNGSNALTARINNIIGANVVLDLTDTVYAGGTIVIRMAPDNNTANTIRVQGNITNAWGAPTTSTDIALPGATGKIYANYNFIL